MFIYFGWNVEAGCFTLHWYFKKGWIIEIGCEREGMYLAHILATGSCVEVSGENRADDCRNYFPKLFFPQSSLFLAVGLEQCMS